jgi:hypothetical protein
MSSTVDIPPFLSRLQADILITIFLQKCLIIQWTSINVNTFSLAIFEKENFSIKPTMMKRAHLLIIDDYQKLLKYSRYVEYVIWNDDNSFPCISKMNEVIFSLLCSFSKWAGSSASTFIFRFLFYILQNTSVTPVCSVHSALLWTGSLRVLNVLKTLECTVQFTYSHLHGTLFVSSYSTLKLNVQVRVYTIHMSETVNNRLYTKKTINYIIIVNNRLYTKKTIKLLITCPKFIIWKIRWLINDSLSNSEHTVYNFVVV